MSGVPHINTVDLHSYLLNQNYSPRDPVSFSKLKTQDI